MRVVLAGGGTGGHILPLKLVYEKLKTENSDFYYITKKNDLFKDKFMEGIKSYGIFSYPYKRKKSIKDLFFFSVRNFAGIIESFIILKKLRPDIVITTGGYTSFPFCLACLIKKVKVYCLEGNALPGLFVKFFSSFKNFTVLAAFEKTKENLKTKKAAVKLTGYPVKKEFLEDCGSVKNLITIAGGSQGASSLADFVLNFGEKLADELDCEIYAAIGQNIKKFKNKEFKRVRTVEFDIEIYKKMKTSKTVVLRAGANSVNETLYIGAYSIFVPYPYASEDHQYHNALETLKKRPGKIIRETEPGFHEILYGEIKKSYGKIMFSEPLKENAADKIKNIITADLL